MKDLFKAFSDAHSKKDSDDALALYEAVFTEYSGESHPFYYFSFEDLVDRLERLMDDTPTQYSFEGQPLETVELYSGDEGGFTMDVRLVVKHNDSYIRITGWYSSWDGMNWESITRVEPFEQTIVEYREVSV